MYQKILVPLDGSDTAARGFQEACGLARALGGSLVLLHVIEPYPPTAGMEWVSADTWQQIIDGLRARGQDIVDQCRRDAVALGVATESFLIESLGTRVADVIVDTARQHHCELIVMGTHGRRGWSRLALGSDAERVTRQSLVPLLLVRHAGASGT